MQCMNTPNTTNPSSFTLAELCVLADLSIRTVRYYVQIGLVDKPEGETRAAKYGALQLEQLLLIKKWTSAGLALERIRELLHGSASSLPEPKREPGSVAVRSHVMVSDGVEIVIDPARSGWTPEQVRRFVQGVMQLHEQMLKSD